MSEQPAAGPARKSNVFTNKIGPLPMWAWVGIIGAAFLVWRWYSGSKANAAQAAATTPSTPADQVPQFVNQTYVTTTPPGTPTTPAPVPVPSSGGNPPPPPTGIPSGWRPWRNIANMPPTNPPPVVQFPPPTGLRTTSVGNTSVGLQWTTVPSGTRYPPSYTVAIYNSRGKLASETTVSTPDTTGSQGVTTVTGLAQKTAYHANVWANGGEQAPKHATVSFKTT